MKSIIKNIKTKDEQPASTFREEHLIRPSFGKHRISLKELFKRTVITNQ